MSMPEASHPSAIARKRNDFAGTLSSGSEARPGQKTSVSTACGITRILLRSTPEAAKVSAMKFAGQPNFVEQRCKRSVQPSGIRSVPNAARPRGTGRRSRDSSLRGCRIDRARFRRDRDDRGADSSDVYRAFAGWDCLDCSCCPPKRGDLNRELVLRQTKCQRAILCCDTRIRLRDLRER